MWNLEASFFYVAWCIKEALAFASMLGNALVMPFFWRALPERAADWAHLTGLRRAGTSLATSGTQDWRPHA